MRMRARPCYGAGEHTMQLTLATLTPCSGNLFSIIFILGLFPLVPLSIILNVSIQLKVLSVPLQL